jgi:hypothetical protein
MNSVSYNQNVKNACYRLQVNKFIYVILKMQFSRYIFSCLIIQLFIYLFVYLFVYLYVCMFVYIFIIYAEVGICKKIPLSQRPLLLF